MDSIHNLNSSTVYERAIARIELDLGFTARNAHGALARFAATYGLFLDDVAQAVLGARTITQGLNRALKQVVFPRRPLVKQ